MLTLRTVRTRALLAAAALLLALAATTSPAYAWPPIFYINEYYYYANGQLVGYEYADECTGYTTLSGVRTSEYTVHQSQCNGYPD